MPTPADERYAPLEIDVKYLTGRELKDIMDNAGLSADDLDNPMNADDPGRALTAIAWVIRRREYPDLTFEESWDIPVALDDVPVDPTPASN